MATIIKDIRIEQDKGLTVVFVENFGKDLQALIRTQLAGIFHGFSEVEELKKYYSYSNTLTSFWDRYKSKSEAIKKGMIGELLAHVLINALFDKLSCLSILKNKEERSIKKGFDIIYYHKTSKDLWYTEVKSGKSSSPAASSDAYNLELLKRSKDSILEMFSSRRKSLWESAMIDVKLAVEEGSRRIRMRELLSNETPTKRLDPKRNVILVSVLYHPLKDRVTLNKAKVFKDKIQKDKIFKNAVLFSIQKETYQKVATFLHSESNKS